MSKGYWVPARDRGHASVQVGWSREAGMASYWYVVTDTDTNETLALGGLEGFDDILPTLWELVSKTWLWADWRDRKCPDILRSLQQDAWHDRAVYDKPGPDRDITQVLLSALT